VSASAYWRAFSAIVHRELLRFWHQRERLVAALVRPLLWLIVFGAGFRTALGLSITPPYQSYILYEVYIVPGLCGMILLFAGMQSSLAMVYDRAMGALRVLLTAPFPRWFLLLARLAGGTLTAILQVYAFLVITLLYGIDLPWQGLLTVLPALILSGLMIGAAGLLIASFMRRVENFAGIMNFVIFPAFFLSSALYPLWRVQEASPTLAWICVLNPFTHAVELIRFSLYGQFEPLALAVVMGVTVLLLAMAVWAYDPARSFRAGRTATSPE
jgi:ABC-2 type transport system permease protein